MSTWEVEHDRTNVVCPDCAFSFDAIHQDGDGGYTCPLCEPAPASGDPSGADAVVREAAPFSDTAVARIIEAVEKHCGMGHGAWDMVSARDLVEGFAAVFGADTRRVDALVEALRITPFAREAYNEGVVVAYDNVADSLRALIAHGRRVTKRDVWGVIEGVERAASQIASYAGRRPTAPGAPEEGAGE